MRRDKMSPIEQYARDSLADFNDRRHNMGTEGIAAKELRALQKFFDRVPESENDEEGEES